MTTLPISSPGTLDLAALFEQGFGYEAFLEKYGNDEQKRRWSQFHGAVKLAPAHVDLLKSFTREMRVFCLAGAWCGDCVNQCPIFDHFERVNPLVKMRYFDRDANPELGQKLSVCGGARVPVILFVSEDNFQVGMYGDRTLSKYRQLVGEMAGAACPTGIVLPGQSQIDGVIQDWLDEFERVQWSLRTSARLRKLHND
jgi:hypothetical protein